MNMSRSLCLTFGLMLLSCGVCAAGKEESHEEETTASYYDYTVTSDYDYNATFDYFYMTGHYLPDTRNKAAGIGPLSLVLLLGLAVSEIWN